MNMTNEQIQALKARYAEPEVPNCRICGEKMHITRAGGGSVVYGCDGRVEGDGYAFKEGRDFADKHYEQSRETVYNLGDPDVIALLAEREAHKALIAEQATRITELENLKEQYCTNWANAEKTSSGLEVKIAELEARMLTVKLPDELYAIAENIRTQDNRCTDQPMFAVMQKREIIGSDEHSPSRIVWCWDGEEVSELRASRLEALHQGCRDTRGYDRYAMQEIDEFVTACFTEQGCKDYLARDGHNLRLPFIYAFGSFRNSEYQFVRKWLAGITLKVGGE